MCVKTERSVCAFNAASKGKDGKHYLPKNEVHIWCTFLNESIEKLPKIKSLLSADERKRANHFFFKRHQNRFILCRGLLRLLIGSYLGIDPKQIEFGYRKKGKPVLNGVSSFPGLFFNVSHSKELALFAFSRCPKVGIDVEYIQYDSNMEWLENRLFHQGENAFLRNFDARERTKEFYHLWTSKEAFLKATGVGLSGLQKIEILNNTEKQIVIHKADGGLLPLNGWGLYQFIPAPNFSAALAIKGTNRTIKFDYLPAASYLY